MQRAAGTSGHFKTTRRTPNHASNNMVVPLPIKAKSQSVESEAELNFVGSPQLSGCHPAIMANAGDVKKGAEVPVKKIPPSTVWGEGTRSFLIGMRAGVDSPLDDCIPVDQAQNSNQQSSTTPNT